MSTALNFITSEHVKPIATLHCFKVLSNDMLSFLPLIVHNLSTVLSKVQGGFMLTFLSSGTTVKQMK
jgi:hypothetical protein